MVHQADVCGAMCELSARARAFSVEALLGAKRARVGSSTSPQEDWSSTNSEKNTLENVSFSSERFIPKTWAKDENMMYQPESTKPTSPLAKLKHKLNVELCSRDLWKKFHALGTEMIITKAGRRMFPTVKVRLTGLDPSASYIVFLDIVAVDDKRYRYVYHSSQWMVAGSGDPSNSTNLYVHPDSPATGQLWMAQGVVAFDKLKLTNNKKPLVRGQVSLHSMHKYQPRVHIMLTTDLETQPEKQVNQQKALSFTFPETTFTTVTAYQNQQITRLKIASNPFAKGFREASRTRQYMDDTQNESSSSFIIPSIMGSTKLHSNELFGLDSQLELLSTPSVLQCGQSVASLPEFFSSALPKCQPLTLPVKFVVPPPGCHTMLYNHDNVLQMSSTERQQLLSRNDPIPKTNFLKNMHVGMSVKCTETANSEISYFSNCIELSQHRPFSSSGNIDFLKEKYANNTVTKEQQEVLKANDTIKTSEKNLSDDIFYSSYDTSIKDNQMYINIKGNPRKYGPICNVYKDRTNEYSSLRSIFNVYGQTISKPLDLSKIK